MLLLIAHALHARAEAEPPDAVVVGAGFAGLAAAAYLCERGYNVTVLESRARLGGRVRTEELGGVTVELGAGWLHGASYAFNSLVRLARANSIRTPVGSDDTRGTWRLDARAPAAATLTPVVDEGAWEACAGAFASHITQRQREWSQTETLRARFDEWVRARSMSDDAVAGCAALVASDAADLEYGASAAQLGAAQHGVEHELRGGDALVHPADGGYAALVRALRERIERARAGSACSVRTGATVAAIERGGADSWERASGGVVVELVGGERLRRTFAISTLPLGVLQARGVAFRPELHERKRGALGRLGVGLLNRVILVYSTPFWAEEAHGERCWLRPVVFTGGAQDGGAPLPVGAALEFWNGARFGARVEGPSGRGPAAVALLVGAELARSWEDEASDLHVVQRIDDLFRRMFPGAGSDGASLVASTVTRWGNESASRGAFSFLPPRATPADREVLCRADGGDRPVLFWAGEHCSVQMPATTHGAYDTGVAAAQMAEQHFPLPGRLTNGATIAVSVFAAACGCAVAVGLGRLLLLRARLMAPRDTSPAPAKPLPSSRPRSLKV
ncbi:hypothetical protein KFE25_006074 [Diacronema lutheri]|uniref:Amine oxidase domain-containing protein n=2 Tax=Diacronema lutheri TaxID=2081491 RepID=A0A8J5XSB6_DIALT|nr:hypothetical protein KFE25_006074 [Diacronema lutheri]